MSGVLMPRLWILASAAAALAVSGLAAHTMIERRYRLIDIRHMFADAELSQWLVLGFGLAVIAGVLAWYFATNRHDGG